jgi:hypothetical protein
MKHALEYINRRLEIEEESNISLVGHYMSEHNICQCVSLTRIYLWMVRTVFGSFILGEDVYFIFGGVNVCSNSISL